MEHELWKLPWHLQNFIFFLQQKLCFRLNIIKMKQQILGQKLILKCYLDLLLSIKNSNDAKKRFLISNESIYIFSYLLKIEQKSFSIIWSFFWIMRLTFYSNLSAIFIFFRSSEVSSSKENKIFHQNELCRNFKWIAPCIEYVCESTIERKVNRHKICHDNFWKN